jgi:TadE-like protein
VTRSRRLEAGQSVVEFALVLPLMLIMLFAILDFARIYTTMMSVESAAREAADYGTTLGAGKWQVGAPADATEAEMRRRACVAASDLTGYADPDSDPATGNCTNPTFAFCMTPTVGGPCGPLDASAGCDDPLRTTPCRVTVTLTFDFRLIAPLGIDFYGVHYGVPASITLQRDSTFAMTDIDLATGP